jgi:LysR family transcriptional regulator, carnitine catabolism transcriptional activator
MLMKIGLRALQAFRRVAELRSFSLAAEQMRVSQPALSASIRKLEETLGVRVFDRTTRQVLLTPDGRELLRLATRMIDEYESVFGDFQDYLAQRRGRVVIAALPSVAAVVLPPVLGRFRAAHEAIDIHIRDTIHNAVLDEVSSGAADFGLTVAPAGSTELAFERLLTDAFVLVCPRDHKLAGLSAVTWREIARHPIVAPTPTSSVRQAITAACAKSGVDLRVAYEAEHLSTMGGLLAAGLGIAALPSLSLPLLGSNDFAVVPLKKPSVERTIGIVRRAGRTPSVAAAALLRELSAAMPRVEAPPAGRAALSRTPRGRGAGQSQSA